MLDKLFRAHSEKNGAAMNGTASTKEGPPNGVLRALSERPTPDMLRRTDSMTAFHAQKEFQDRTVSIGNDVPRTVNGTGHTGPSEFCATSI